VLLEVWRNAGCTTTFPVNEGPDGWWRNHELVIVENDMQLWYEYAMDGQSTYRAACFGNQEDLLMQWYALRWVGSFFTQYWPFHSPCMCMSMPAVANALV
jgi:hypothetical protein